MFPRCPPVSLTPSLTGRSVSRTDRRTDRRTDTSPCISVVFSFSYKLPKTVTVTTLLLFGPVMLHHGTFLFIWLGEGPVQFSDCAIDTPSLHTAGLSVHTNCCYPGQQDANVSIFFAAGSVDLDRRRFIGVCFGPPV